MTITFHQQGDGREISLPHTWFESRITLEQIRSCFAKGNQEIRIASGFFTVKGWSLIRRYTENKQVYLLVGIDEPGEERAKAALVREIMRHLARGLDRDRRSSVLDLVRRIEERSLYVVDARASAHHGKLYIVDRDTAISASANTTARGFLDQVESGGLYAPEVVDRFVLEYGSRSDVRLTSGIIKALREFIEAQVANFIAKFDEYFENAADITGHLLQALQQWLQLVRPWDIYLKTILALEQVQPVRTTYPKHPVSYQKDMIAQALRQIRSYGGSMLVASTGLGKTVMGIHIAIQLQAEGLIDRAIAIAPLSVQKTWRKEMRLASLHSEHFNLQVLDKANAAQAGDLEIWEEIVREIAADRGRYLLIFDESHQLRKRYPDSFVNRRTESRRVERRAFTRINHLVNQIGGKGEKVKILLLSGSPYATEIDNLNTQLFLLPHTQQSWALFPEFDEEGTIWRVNTPEEFINLPVVHQLTTPHVARYYSEREADGKPYITFGKDKRYFPDVLLYSMYFHLLLEEQISPIIDEYFDLAVRNPAYRKNIVTQMKICWGSSPLALLEIFERIIDTPGGQKEFDFAKRGSSVFESDRETRRRILEPLVGELENLPFLEDPKIQNLLYLIDTFCPAHKAIVFCERRATAYYLERALAELMPQLRIFSTVESPPRVIDGVKQYHLKKTAVIQEAISWFAPVANDAKSDRGATYDVFISTDAFGIGVNMQDACVVINYDLAWTPIEPTQRAGRILRLWSEPRMVHLYTFVPTLSEPSYLRDELQKTIQRWDNLLDRHAISRQIVDLPVLTSKTHRTVRMSECAGAPKTTIVSSSLSWSAEEENRWVSSYYLHTHKLHPHRDYAENLGSDLTSALTYGGKHPKLYLLVTYQQQYHFLLYDARTNRVSLPTPEVLLDLIATSPETEPALVEEDEIEALSDACLRIWCEQQEIDVEEVARECTLYLQPERTSRQVADLLH
jgi:hypothetical protein